MLTLHTLSTILLTAFLSYTSQPLLRTLSPPSPPSPRESTAFNTLVACVWICYVRACRTDAGVAVGGRGRWCSKCARRRGERAHHCRACGRCVPKMDHHCPWTNNCVSHYTFPHFVRFLVYAVVAMGVLEWFLVRAAGGVWGDRALPDVRSTPLSSVLVACADAGEAARQYLGPSVYQLVYLLILLAANSLTLFAIFILLVRSLWSLVTNTYAIEAWEIERHEALVRRARKLGGFVDGPGGVRVRIDRQEFPYDVGFWRNVVQGMGSANVCLFSLPLPYLFHIHIYIYIYIYKIPLTKK
jgi:palmitoyltransferase